MIKNNKTKAVVLMLISSLSFAFMGALVKVVTDIPSFEKALFRNLISLIVVIMVLYYRKESPWGQKENRRYLIGRSIFGTIGLVTYFYSIDHLLLADASMFNRLSPFFVIIFAAIFLKEKIKRYQVLSVVVAFIGVLLIIKPGFNFGNYFNTFIGLLSGVSAGAAYIFVSYLGKKENAFIVVFYFSLISTIVTAIMTIPIFIMPTLLEFILLVGAGVFASVGQFTLTYAYKYAPAGEVSIYVYANIIFASILGLIFFSEMPDVFSFVGYLLIILAGYIIYKYGRTFANKVAEEENVEELNNVENKVV
ncbi:EamA domain-containing membrane protein RarD [Natranaerovirga pectinivora]|uniref:EamA domain-containing membrane protein RarD n=1 Tax=Natranaerovirga pectinivora TaxID=682400 RepID=A0A4R3MME9_9FIRM|nr:DMT family transporter [Natranaerovirga pectinivora]TCT16123.1 EamA domain-containing membrane protein RarD [Natranaerovirga pectinivora]